MNCNQAKQIDIVDFLARCKHFPAYERGDDKWFLSPLRDEKTPSFKVDHSDNVWYDFGQGIGGTIIDLGIRMFRCGISEFLEKLSGSHINCPLKQTDKPVPTRPFKREPVTRIIGTTPIMAPALFYYLRQRGIPYGIAHKYLEQVTFKVRDKQLYSLGFRNRSGGYELRSVFYKGSASPKDIFLEQRGGNKLAVFEGNMDFLTYLVDPRQSLTDKPDILVLNSTAFFGRSVPIMEGYSHVRLFLNHDNTGRECTKSVCDEQKVKGIYEDCSELYQGWNDYNAWWMDNYHLYRYQRKPGFSL